MRAILLCPGPSLKLCPVRPDEGHQCRVIGVNRAAVAHACDDWVALDWILIERIRGDILGSPGLVTNQPAREALARHRIAWRGPLEVVEDFLEMLPRPPNWTLYSATVALAWAVIRGARRIDVWGVDWSGTLDFDGTAAGENRSQDRWRTESAIWIGMVGRLKQQQGIEVIRHVVQGPVDS